MPRRSICIVTRGSLSCGPRVVKEADALSREGHAVHVVAYQDMPWAVPWDAELARTRAWTFEAVRSYAAGVRPRYMALKTGVRQRCYRELARRVTFGAGFAERAFSRPFDELVARARAVAADLYVAHNAEALPAAHAAARARGAGLAFDSEDLHTGDQGDGGAGDLRAELLNYFERRCLPACRYVTVPSQPIADALVERYGIARPVTVHNVFPLTDRARLDGQRRDRRSRALSLYWYSQVVGLDRGLQDAVHALGRLRGSVELHVRGKLAPNVEHELRRLAREHRVEGQLIFHALVHPNELLARTAEHDIGLALEQPVSRNRLLTVTNKLFFYMLAGLGLCATATPGQDAIMKTVPDAGFCYAPGDAEALARELQRFIDQPELLARARAASLEAARTRYNLSSSRAR